MRTLVKDVSSNIGEKVTVSGWLHKQRKLGGLNFINIRDRSGVAQALIQDKDQAEKLRGMQIGTVINVTGTVAKDDRAPGGAELHDVEIEVVVPVEDVPPIEVDKPIDHKSENHDTLFENRVVNARNLTEQSIFKIKATVASAMREYFDQNEFTEIHTPKLLAEPTEGGAEVFKMDYFGKVATLAQSPQFYKQMMVGVFERVFEIAPVYRAEPSSTVRHMTEYISVDGEMGFIDLEDLKIFLSGMLNHVVDAVWKKHETELKRLNATKPKLTAEIPSISLEEIHELYSRATNESTNGEKDLSPGEEKWICEYAKKKFNSEAVFVTKWPASEMKFYHKAEPNNPDVADRFDLLFRGVEIVTGSMREHDYETVVKQLKEQADGDPENPGYKPFLMAMQFGMPPHGGFGMGLERVTQKIIGLNNIKEAALFPRDINRLAP